MSMVLAIYQNATELFRVRLEQEEEKAANRRRCATSGGFPLALSALNTVFFTVDGIRIASEVPFEKASTVAPACSIFG